jgi:hypothetical protein
MLNYQRVMGIQHRTIPGGCLLAGRCGSSGGIVFDVAGLPTRPVVPWSDRLDLPSNCPICRFFEPNMEKTPSTLLPKIRTASNLIC